MGDQLTRRPEPRRHRPPAWFRLSLGMRGRSCLAALRAAGRSLARWDDLLPHRGPRHTRRDLRPRGFGHWLSVVLLWVVFAGYLGTWIEGQWGWLTDPMLQNDDARTSLFPFHKYGPEGALREDPIANEMIVIAPPAQHLMYGILVPIVGLYGASKVVQLLCLLVLFAAGALLIRAKRAGLAAGVLLVFLVLHAPYMVNRMAGGHMRGFVYPLFGLWAAGAMAGSERTRFLATLLAAPLYAPSAALLLAAEGLFAVRGGFRFRSAWFVSRLRRYALLVAACVVLVMPQTIVSRQHGRVHTLQEARQEPAFVHSARRVLPFQEPAVAMAWHFVEPYRAAGRTGIPLLAEPYADLQTTGPLLVICGLMILIMLRLAPTPWPAMAFICATIVMYALARMAAFRFYNPERYYSYGMQAASVMLVVSTVGLAGVLYRDRRLRAIVRNLASAGFIVLLCGLAGDGVLGPPENGMTIDGRRNARLYEFLRTLPADVRIATHPSDGAGISYWSARATTDNYETLQPWLVEPWLRFKARTKDTLRALYARRPGELLAYCQRYGITHLLINTRRYGEDFRLKASVFPPFDEFIESLLAGVDRDQLVVRRLPEHAEVFVHEPWVVFDVSLVTQVQSVMSDEDG